MLNFLYLYFLKSKVNTFYIKTRKLYVLKVCLYEILVVSKLSDFILSRFVIFL